MLANVYRKIQRFLAEGYILYAVLTIILFCDNFITINCLFSHFYCLLIVGKAGIYCSSRMHISRALTNKLYVVSCCTLHQINL